MGLFDQIVSLVSDKLTGGDVQSGLLGQAINLLSDPDSGGLTGLIDKFKNNGLGDIVSSWVGTGENSAISADQISSALGADKIQAIAGKLGFSDNQVADGLASILPQVIDKLTPQGSVPENSILEQGIKVLSEKFLKG